MSDINLPESVSFHLLGNKFDFLVDSLNNYIDILLIVETKLDDSFPMNQFRIDGFQLYYLDRCSHGGGLILYIRDNIPAKELKQYKLPNVIEAIIIEINLWKRKWMLCGNYNPHKGRISYHLENISKLLDFYLSKYDNILSPGDFSCEEKANFINDFLCTNNLKHLVKKPRCFKNVNNPSIIDFILTNKNNIFYHTDVLETGLSDFHKLVFTILKSSYIKLKWKVITYRCFKSFDVEALRLITDAFNTLET